MTVSLSVNDLFIPAPSGVGPFGNVPAVPASGTWLGIMLGVAETVQLPTTSWQPGAPERTILAIEAVCFSQSDVDVSIMAQGGFLQSAASGSVSYTSTDGTPVTIPVTPDPSNPSQNPTGALGWEDLLATNVYDVERLTSTRAGGPLAIVNLTGSTKGPYSPGTYHVGNTQTGATYNNPSSLSIPTSVIAGSGGVVSGVGVGLTFSIIHTVSAHGLTAGQSTYVNIPTTSGVAGLAGVFAVVTSATTLTFQISVSSSGTWTAGGNVYLCTTATMQADIAGMVGNASPGAVTTTITQNANVFASNPIAWSGSNWESNQGLLNRCVLSLANRSPNGPAQSYVYFAETAQQLLAAQTPAYQLTNGAVAATEFSSPQTGIVTTVVASSSPASSALGQAVTPGCSQLPVSGVSNANPAIITCTGPTSLAPGQSMTVSISGVLGIAGVNGTFLGTYTGANAFSIPVDTTAAGTYSGGGSVEGGDLGQIDQLIQHNVVPDDVTAITTSALALPITIVATVVVPQAFVSTYQLAVGAQLAEQLASYDMGGDVKSVPPNSVPWDDVLAALEEAGVIALGQPSYVVGVQALSVSGNATTVTASGTGIAFPSNVYQALLAVPSITVLGV